MTRYIAPDPDMPLSPRVTVQIVYRDGRLSVQNLDTLEELLAAAHRITPPDAW